MGRIHTPHEPDHSWIDYDWETKERRLGPIFHQLDREGKIGMYAADIGCGDRPVSDFIPRRRGRRVFTFDSDPYSPRAVRHLPGHLVFNVNGLIADNQDTYEAQAAVVEMFRATGRKLAVGTKIEEFLDFMVISDLLNWLPDYQGALDQMLHFLKPGGRILIANMPGRGVTTFGDLVFGTQPKAGGPSNNSELFAFLRSKGVLIESVWKMDDGQPISHEPLLAADEREWLITLGRKPSSPLITRLDRLVRNTMSKIRRVHDS